MVRNLFRDLYRSCTGARRPYVRPNKPAKKMQLHLEVLEDRLTPAPLVAIVTNDNDSGPGSLRAAVIAVNGNFGGEVDFDNSVDNGSGPGVYDIVLNSTITITAPIVFNASSTNASGFGASSVTVDGQGSVQLFNAPTGKSINVTFIGDSTGDPSNPSAPNFILQNGFSFGNGGAIDLEDPNSSLALYNMEIISNSAVGNGGGVYCAGSVGIYGVPTQTAGVDSSYIEGNTADAFGIGIGNGGGVWAGRQLIIDQTFVANNQADNGGGAFDGPYAGGGGSSQVQAINDVFQGNLAGPIGTGNGGAIWANYNVFVSSSEFGGYDGNGQEAGNEASGSGGAIFSNNGNVNVDTGVGGTAFAGSGSLFQFNQAAQCGGAISAKNNILVGPAESPDVFSQNVAGGNGGALYAKGLISVLNTYLFGNTASTGSGGAIWSNGNVNVGFGSEIGSGAVTGYTNIDPYTADGLSGGNFAKLDGGGIWANHNVKVDATFGAVDIVFNHAGRNGGGIFDNNWTVTVQGFESNNANIAFNTAGGAGGGIYNASGEIDLVGGADNIAFNTATGDGGGLWTNSGAINIFAQTYIFNNTAKDGGGIFVGTGGTLFIDGSEGDAIPGGLQIYNNRSTAASTIANSGGGGIDAQGSAEVTILYAFVWGNSANSDGGGLLAHNVLGTQVSYSTFEANSSKSGNNGGGGIAVIASSLNYSFSADDNTISENTAKSHGGGMLISGADAFLNHNTFADNATLTSGTGVSGRDLYGSNLAKVYLENNLFADFNLSLTSFPGNVSEIGAQHTSGGKFVEIISMGHNLTTDASLGSVTNYKPNNGDIQLGHQFLEPKTYNGSGLTPSYALVPGGQAIGGGDMVGPPIDQDGNVRPFAARSSIGSTETSY